MAINKDEAREWRARTTPKQTKASRGAAQGRLSGARGQRLVEPVPLGQFVGLAELLARGELTRVIIRGDDVVGWTFTIKANLAGFGPSYLHGEVHTCNELPSTIDAVIEKGRWHTDRYPAKE